MKRKYKIMACAMACLLGFSFVPNRVSAQSMPYEQLKEHIDTDELKEVYNIIFDKNLVKENVKVVTEDESKSIPVAITKLPNGKVGYTINGEAFYPMAVETGWWDTRVDNNGQMSSNPAQVGDKFKEITNEEWNKYFSDMKNLGFNTVQLMTHWKDWEPQKGKYDFTFLDNVTNIAAENGLKTEFIIFFHSQTDNIPREMDNFWGYKFDSKEINGEEYALSMQWGNDLTSSKDIRDYRNKNNYSAGVENFLEYWHPDVFEGINNALTELAKHYKDSPNIIGYQIGNEEGFNYYVDNGDDKNPYYLAMKEMWLKDNPNGDIKQFRVDMVNNIWKIFSNSIHKGDPYKPTTTNTQSGNTEKFGVTVKDNPPDGMTMDIYKSVDMVGSMFYGDAWKLYDNLDKYYSGENGQQYAKGFPILFPTEISASMNDGSVSKQIVAQTIARGGQGFGLYCYGELYNNFEQNGTEKPKEVVGTIKTMLSTLKEVENLIYSGIPVNKENSKNIFISLEKMESADTNQGNATLSVLEKDDKNALGILHFPKNSNSGKNDIEAFKERVATISINSKEKGEYRVTTYNTNGSKESQNIYIKEDNQNETINISLKGTDVLYIKVEKI